MIDRSAFDRDISGTEEEPEETDAMPPMTTASAIRDTIFWLRWDLRDWGQRPDPNGVLPHINELIACLEQAQRELEAYAKVKQALKVLRDVI
jgi:hypothetical protein